MNSALHELKDFIVPTTALNIAHRGWVYEFFRLEWRALVKRALFKASQLFVSATTHSLQILPI